MRRFTHTFPQRISAFLLCLALCLSLLPSAAFAAGTDTGKAIQIGASGISGYDSTNSYDYIYYGNWTAPDRNTTSGPIKWRVLSMNGNSGTYSDGTNTVDAKNAMFLLSDVLLGTGTYGGVYFDNSGSDSNVWQKSTAQTWCKNFYSNNFSSKEQNAVLETTKSDTEFTSSTYRVPFAASENILNGDKVFFLSAEEAENSKYGFTDENSRIANYGNNARNWRLRSPRAGSTYLAGLVNLIGGVDNFTVNYGCAARPAFNLDLNSVLFISAAVGGKSSGAVGADALQSVSEYAENEWKLTLLDGGRSFTASTSSATTQTQGYSNWTVEVTYSGAQTGSNEYVSAMLVDGSGSVLYYGRVAQPGEATGTATITIPNGLTAGNYTLKVFSEQCNGDKMTDYASAFQDVVLHVHSWSAAWSSDDTHHWHNCTAAACPVSDNSQKDGYAEHVYDRQVATDSYLASPATCTQAATYYKSCSCGAKGTETFTSGNPTGHTPEADWKHDNGSTHWKLCEKCGAKVEETAHVYDDGQDDTCNACEYVRTTYTLTINLNNGSGSTTGGEYAEGAVIHIDAGSRSNYRFDGWTSSNGGSFASASSASTTFTMPAVDTTITANWQYDSPYIPPSKPNWISVARKLANAQPGDTVTVKMNGETEVPGDVWETIAGRDVTVILDMGGNVSWTVDGNDVPTATHFADMDFGVDRNTTGIDVDVINAITGEVSSVQITLAHDGEFGFTLTLTAPLGKENAGYWANLYHYDEENEILNYETSGEIQEDGTASLKMTHASQYAIIIDDQTHQLPFEDVTSGTWYEGAVRYAYLHDIMEGMSATTFQPNGTLTRAQAVQIFYNLEGKPDISDENLGYPYEDVDAQAWYGDAVYWARITGVATGYGDGTFQPTDSITRQEFAQMLYNYAKYKGYDLTAEGDLSQFPDSGSVADWAEAAMSWANGNELINGHDDGTLEPGGTTTRAQAASILMRFDQNLVEK